MIATVVAVLIASIVVTAAEPNTCQPRSEHPFMPIYHIIGNVRIHMYRSQRGGGGRPRRSLQRKGLFRTSQEA